MRKHARTGQVFTHQRRAQHGLIDFQQDQRSFAGVIFPCGSRNLMLLGAMDEALNGQVSACKRAIALCALPVGLFRYAIDHAARSTCRIAILWVM
ncbi:MAG: hypothetical protein ABI583_10920 [Betaproteobacteria bacterium]